MALLVALLLPALESARRAAIRVQCASNVRQLTQATFFYAQDYDQALFGYEDPPDMHSARVKSSPSFFTYYRDYLGESVRRPNKRGQSLRYFTRDVFVCPSNPIGYQGPAAPYDFHRRNSYAFFGNSMRDLKVTPDKLRRGGAAYLEHNKYYSASGADLPDDLSIPALWADRIAGPSNEINGYKYTNHKPGGPGGIYGPAKGGNVGRVDGSVAWQPNNGTSDDTSGTYLYWGGFDWQKLVPSSALSPAHPSGNMLDSDGDLQGKVYGGPGRCGGSRGCIDAVFPGLR
jgi:hypothetical protein